MLHRIVLSFDAQQPRDAKNTTTTTTMAAPDTIVLPPLRRVDSREAASIANTLDAFLIPELVHVVRAYVIVPWTGTITLVDVNKDLECTAVGGCSKDGNEFYVIFDEGVEENEDTMSLRQQICKFRKSCGSSSEYRRVAMASYSGFWLNRILIRDSDGTVFVMMESEEHSVSILVFNSDMLLMHLWPVPNGGSGSDDEDTIELDVIPMDCGTNMVLTDSNELCVTMDGILVFLDANDGTLSRVMKIPRHLNLRVDSFTMWGEDKLLVVHHLRDDLFSLCSMSLENGEVHHEMSLPNVSWKIQRGNSLPLISICGTMCGGCVLICIADQYDFNNRGKTFLVDPHTQHVVESYPNCFLSRSVCLPPRHVLSVNDGKLAVIA